MDKKIKLVIILLIISLMGQTLFGAPKKEKIPTKQQAFINAMKNNSIDEMRDALESTVFKGKVNLSYCLVLVLTRFGGFNENLVLDALRILAEYDEKTSKSKSVTIFYKDITVGGRDDYVLLYEHAQDSKYTIALRMIPVYGQVIDEKVGKYKKYAGIAGVSAPLAVAMHIDISPPHSNEILKYMIENGGWNSWRNFVFLIEHRKYDLAKLCLDKGFDINRLNYVSTFTLKDFYGFTLLASDGRPISMTPVDCMIYIDNLDGVKFLVENGATVSSDAMEIAKRYRDSIYAYLTAPPSSLLGQILDDYEDNPRLGDANWKDRQIEITANIYDFGNDGAIHIGHFGSSKSRTADFFAVCYFETSEDKKLRTYRKDSKIKLKGNVVGITKGPYSKATVKLDKCVIVD